MQAIYIANQSACRVFRLFESITSI